MKRERYTIKEMQSCIDKLKQRMQLTDDLINAFPLYQNAINGLQRRIDELTKIKTT